MLDKPIADAVSAAKNVQPRNSKKSTARNIRSALAPRATKLNVPTAMNSRLAAISQLRGAPMAESTPPYDQPGNINQSPWMTADAASTVSIGSKRLFIKAIKTLLYIDFICFECTTVWTLSQSMRYLASSQFLATISVLDDEIPHIDTRCRSKHNDMSRLSTSVLAVGAKHQFHAGDER